MVTTVTMAHRVSSQGRADNSQDHAREPRPALTSLAAAMLLAGLALPATAAQWEVTPRLTLGQIYTDNLRLSADNEESESITEIRPGISFVGRGARMEVSAEYSMQNLFYASNSGNNTINHQLKAGEKAELIEDWFYFDSSASISQQLIDANGPIQRDNLNLTNSRGDVRTLLLEPYLKRDLGRAAALELRYAHGWVDYGSGARGAAADTESSSVRARIANGRGASHLFWRLSHTAQQEDRDGADDSERNSTEGRVQLRVVQEFSLLGYAGREENDIRSNNVTPDGSYWSAGFVWQPSPKFAFEATAGRNDEQARINWNPGRRTSMDLGYRNRDVGLNTAASWNGSFNHRTRRSTWQLRYSEEVTSVQILALQGQELFQVVDAQGNPLLDPNTGTPLFAAVDVFGLSDEEYLRQRGQASVSYRTGKSTFGLKLSNERRTYQVSLQALQEIGVGASWLWRLGPRTTSKVGIDNERFKSLNTGETGDSVKASVGLTRLLSANANARLEVSREEADRLGSDAQYEENRIAIYLNMTF